ncbi:hypothetical protein RHD99_14765 [Buttiauxella selenatireducens]|uniref:Uncharacterized protein n=1 Tax=Buttiauxella selenatireducens TaxID=3073902 RepID=A0ABY9S5E3_9ENTR|nr:hypothetical protein [Buttiauxella sp. R73]WMY72734.1 hypothetical protein RHD99_14765 [Buttiauxella sp. R73]
MKRFTRENLILIIVMTLELILISQGHIYTAYLLIFLYCGYMAYKERQLFLELMKSAFTIKFYNVVIWFVSYIFSLKILSFTTGIDEDYLKFSPYILAVPVSICIAYMFIVIATGMFGALSILMEPARIILPHGVKASIEKSKFMKAGQLIQFSLVLFVLPFILAAYSTDYIARAAILADAKFISDCGGRESATMYLRKSNEECYRFTLDRHVLSHKPETIKSQKQ